MANKAVDYSKMNADEIAEVIANQKSGIVGTHSFPIKSLKLIAQNNGELKGLIIIDPNDKASQKYNESGKFWLSMGQLQRLCNDAAVPSPLALKHLIDMPGRIMYEADIELRVKGEIFVSNDGEVGVYGEKTDKEQTYATRNESVTLGQFASQKLTEMTLQHSFASSNLFAAFGGGSPAATPTPVVVQGGNGGSEGFTDTEDDDEV